MWVCEVKNLLPRGHNLWAPFSPEENLSVSWNYPGALAGLGSEGGVPTWTPHGEARRVVLHQRKLKVSWIPPERLFKKDR